MVESIADLEECIGMAVDSLSGATASRTGPFISGYISLEGPEFPNELFRQYNQMLTRVDSSLTVSNDEHIRKQIWFLKEVGVVEEVTAEVLALDPEADQDDFDKRFYDISHGVDMSWLGEDVQSIALALAGRKGSSGLFNAIGQPEPAAIPERILNPQRVYYEENNPESAYLDR
ncbi:uncharacterized protein Nmlp_1739 [Natronomonas moolapensis 8.8.11]|uniref:Uncharacterized protein n=1 Tax=Natronomonas moolapensis (strain DSM 18674 / CECT 7526 / JCM 14361 / 8.8.11) TaxID=268739 RepID=M1Y0F4_NATM8|nr:hypothetical protein [Natronomonas moolapensis]CCQ35930.1 uncharacterized protein Nmlp_1739 [Natronomonas moolapensis 8.8.11]